MLIANIPLETKPKKNSRIFNTKTHRSFPSKQYMEWHTAAKMFLTQQMRGKVFGECYIIMVFTHSDKRKRDADNGVSSIFDTLKDAQIIEDDNWQIIKSHHVFNTYCKDKPNCEIRIYMANEGNEYLKDLIMYANRYY